MPKNPTLQLSSVKPPDTRKVRGLLAFKVRSGARPQARGSRRERLEHAPGSKCVVILRAASLESARAVSERALSASDRESAGLETVPQPPWASASIVAAPALTGSIGSCHAVQPCWSSEAHWFAVP